MSATAIFRLSLRSAAFGRKATSGLVVMLVLLAGVASAQPPVAENIVPPNPNEPIVEPMAEPYFDGQPIYDGAGGMAYSSWLDNSYFNLQFQTDHGMGDVPGYFSLGMTNYVWRNDGILMFETAGRVTNEAGGGFSTGFQRRIISGELILGAGAFFDVSSSQNVNYYSQAGASLEALYGLWGLRSNVYVPFGTRENSIAQTDVFINAGDPRFEGTNIVADTQQFFLDETSFGGYEFELSRSVYSLLNDVYGGFYHLQDNSGNKADGWKVGMRGYLFPALQGNITVSDDKVFGTNLYGGFTWFFGRGWTGGPYTMEDKLTLPVVRNHQVASTTTQTSTTGTFTFQEGGVDIEVMHVDSTAGGAEDGSIDNPYSSLTAAEANQAAFDYIYVHSLNENGTAVTFTNQTIALMADKQLLGEGDGNRHLVAVDPAPAGFQYVNAPLTGFIFMPASDAAQNSLNAPRPVINNNAGNTITLADNTTVSNFTINGSGTATSIFANGVAGENRINRLNITGGDFGIDLQNSDGDFLVTAVNITNATDTALNVNGGAADVTFGSPANPTLTQQSQGLYGPSTITQTGVGAGTAVAISGGHTGTFTQAAGSTITASRGDGLQFDDADGIYTFNGAVAFNNVAGGDAGVDILGDSDGEFTFDNLTIANPTGVAFNVDVAGNSPVINVNGGSITKNTAGNVVNIQDLGATGEVNFDIPIASSGIASGIVITNNAAGSVINFNGAVDLGTASRLTGGPGLNLTNNPGDVFFADLDIFTNGQTGLIANNSGSLEITTGRVDVQNGQAIVIDTITDADITLTTVASTNTGGPAVSIQNLGAGSNVALSGLAISGITGDGVFLNENDTDSFVINGGSINNVTGDGIDSTNTDNLTISNMNIGTTGAVNGRGIAIAATDANNQTVRLSNNTIDTNGGLPGVEIDGSAGAGTLFIAQFLGMTVRGGGGGVDIDSAVFDASSGGNTVVTAGTLTIGTAVGDRVQGAGLNLTNVEGNLTVNNLQVFNNGGAGVSIVDTVAPVNPLNIIISDGVINTTGGDAIFTNGFNAGTQIDYTMFSVDVTVDGVAGNDIIEAANTNFAGNGNASDPLAFPTTDNGGNTGTIFFNGGADQFP